MFYLNQLVVECQEAHQKIFRKPRGSFHEIRKYIEVKQPFNMIFNLPILLLKLV